MHSSASAPLQLHLYQHSLVYISLTITDTVFRALGRNLGPCVCVRVLAYSTVYRACMGCDDITRFPVQTQRCHPRWFINHNLLLAIVLRITTACYSYNTATRMLTSRHATYVSVHVAVHLLCEIATQVHVHNVYTFSGLWNDAQMMYKSSVVLC